MESEPPPYPKHETALDRLTPAERLQSLREYAEQQKYVQIGENGTLNTTGAGIRSLACGGPMQHNQYRGSLPPPDYRSDNSESAERHKPSLWHRLIGRRKSSSRK